VSSAMPATHALIELLGEVALLLWGVHMVRTGVLRAFGGDLSRAVCRWLWRHMTRSWGVFRAWRGWRPRCPDPIRLIFGGAR
jgi:hypothetical protein